MYSEKTTSEQEKVLMLDKFDIVTIHRLRYERVTW